MEEFRFKKASIKIIPLGGIEEIGKNIKTTGYIATIENFFEMKEKEYHEILFIHRAEFTDNEDQRIITTLKESK